ncbi:hypothetical protein ACQPW3_01270 [Actinosynnema sp. CA-248983]
MSVMHPGAHVVERVAREVDRLLAVAEHLPVSERRELCGQLGERIAHVQRAHEWTEAFGWMFSVGVLLLGSVFAILAASTPWLPVLLIICAVVTIGVPAVKLWHSAAQALDISIGACLAHSEGDD